MSLKIITLSNFSYREVALNWIKYIENLGIENYEVVCVNKPCYEYLRENGAKVSLPRRISLFRKADEICLRHKIRRRTERWSSAFRLTQRKNKTKVKNRADSLSACKMQWKMIWKLMVTQDFLAAGHDVILSDSDALWLKDPVEDLFYSNSNDVVASTEWGANPPKFKEKYGYTLCMGWIGFRSNPQTIGLLDRVIAKAKWQRKKSDQRAFNNFLMSRNPSVRKSDLGDVFTADGVRILALRTELVTRGKYVPETYVWHPWGNKTPRNKKKVLGKRWLL